MTKKTFIMLKVNNESKQEQNATEFVGARCRINRPNPMAFV